MNNNNFIGKSNQFKILSNCKNTYRQWSRRKSKYHLIRTGNSRPYVMNAIESNGNYWYYYFYGPAIDVEQFRDKSPISDPWLSFWFSIDANIIMSIIIIKNQAIRAEVAEMEQSARTNFKFNISFEGDFKLKLRHATQY